MSDSYDVNRLAEALSSIWRADCCRYYDLTKKIPEPDAVIQDLAGHGTCLIGLRLNPLHELLYWLSAWTRIPFPLDSHNALGITLPKE